MTQIVHEFTIRRKGSDIELSASFEVTPKSNRSGGHAVLDGEIFLAEGRIPWEGKLTEDEKNRIEDEVWETYEGEGDRSSITSDRYLVEEGLDDGFDLDMAIRVSGSGDLIVW
jgi:hypothetical protein